MWAAWLGNGGMHPETSPFKPEAKGGGTAACPAGWPTLAPSPGAEDIRESVLRVLHKGLSNAAQRGLRSSNNHASAKGKILLLPAFHWQNGMRVTKSCSGWVGNL